jgi:hypothetical protein
MLTGEGDDGLVRAFALSEIRFDGVIILNGALNSAAHHHRARLAADFVQGHDLLVKMIHHDLRL